MRKQWSSAAILLLWCIGGARAQVLDLGGGSAPVVDASTATGELAAFLIGQAAEIEAREATTDALRASAAVRRLAAALLDSGQALSSRGAPRLITARTIVAHLADLDHALPALGPRASLVAEDCLELAADLPSAQHTLDRAIRDALAPLTNALAVERSAWGEIEADNASLASLITAPPERVVALSTLDALLARARAWPSHRPSADRTATLIRDAAPALRLPGWIDADLRAMLEAEFDEAIDDLGDPDRSDAGLDTLDRLGALTGLIEAVDQLEPVALQRRARVRVQPLLSSLVGEPARVDRACRAAARVFEQASVGGDDRLESYLPTFVRVAWRHADTDLDAANTRLLDAMLERLDAPDPMTEPALLSAIRAQRQARERLDDLSRIGAYLTGVAPADHPTPRRPKVLADERLLAMRVLELGKRLDDEETAHDAAEQLAAIAGLVKAISTGDREARLRSLDTLAGFTGGDPDRLFDAVDALREDARRQLALIATGGDPDPAPVIARHIDLERLLAALDAAVSISDSARLRLDAWPAWQLSEHGWEALLHGLENRLATATRAAAEGRGMDDEGFAAIRLAAHYAARLPEPAQDGAAGMLAQIAMGVPHRSAPGVSHREDIAALCRDLEELASARLRGEGDRVRALETRIAASAIRVLEIEEAR